MLGKLYSSIITGARFYKSAVKPVKTLTERRPSPNSFLLQTIKESNIKTPQDWKPLRQEILNSGYNFTPHNIDARVINFCTSTKQFNLATKYFEFLHKDGLTPNLATLGNYLKMLYAKSANTGLTPDEEQQIISMYNKIRDMHPILDGSTLESIILGVSVTKDWKLCLKLIDEIKIVSVPGNGAYNAIISAAFLNDEDDVAWKFLSELLENNRAVYPTTYASFLQKIGKNKQPDKLELLDKLCVVLQEHSTKLDPTSLDEFVQKLKRQGFVVNASKIMHRGVCKFCNSSLQSFELTDSEFSKLKTYILKNAIVGKDVFNKTTPEELRRFKQFVANMDEFDVVVDGLNVAYSAGTDHSPMVTSALVASVVSYFVKQKKKVLVLGRTHMNKWPRQNWSYVQQNATLFLTQDISHDDPYLLYCALNSGKNTIVITRDLMRSHKFLLNDNRLKILFDRWLKQRQYHLVRVQDNGVPIFKIPLPFSNVAQKNGKYWHVPSTPDSDNKLQENGPWLCIKYE